MTLISSLAYFDPQQIEVEERSAEEVMVSFKTDDGPRGLKDQYFYGQWDGEQFNWAISLSGSES